MQLNFSDILMDVLKYEQEQRKQGDYQRPLNIASPSNIGKCMRAVVYDEMGINADVPDKLLKIFYHGNLIHDDMVYPILRKYFAEVNKTKNLAVINEYPFDYYVDVDDDQVRVKGFIDNLIMKDFEYIPIEVKSIGNRFFKLQEPLPEHKMQVMVYIHHTGKKYGYVVYIHKPTLESKTFLVEYDEIEYHIIEERIRQLYRYKREGMIPHAEAKIEENKAIGLAMSGKQPKKYLLGQCNYCKHYDLCNVMGLDVVKSE